MMVICYIIEFCVVFGIYWKEFDCDNNKYCVEGNGYSVFGNRVYDFGLVFMFEKFGWLRFEKNRVILMFEVKEFSFGNVLIFYWDKKDDRNWKVFINEQKDFKMLQLGSCIEIVEMFNLIWCNEYMMQCYLDEIKKYVYLFFVVFEVLVMLVRLFYIKDWLFIYLFNFVVFVLNKQVFLFWCLLSEFCKRLNFEINIDQGLKYIFLIEFVNIDRLVSDLEEEFFKCDGEYLFKCFNDLYEVIDEVGDSILNKMFKDVVFDVFCCYVQEVLLVINIF